MKRTIKKAVIGVLAAVVIMSVGAISVFAVGPGRGQGSRQNYVDNDGDGVCDNYTGSVQVSKQEEALETEQVPEQEVIVENGQGTGRGQNFVDNDGDGICDNYAGGGQGNGQGNRFRGGRGR